MFNNYFSIIEYVLILLTLSLLSYIAFSKKTVNNIIFILKSFYIYLLSFLLIFCFYELLSKSNIYLVLEGNNFTFFIILVLSILSYVGIEFYLLKKTNLNLLNYIFAGIKEYLFILIFIILICKNYSFFYVLINSRHSYNVTLIILLSVIIELFFSYIIFKSTIKSYDFSVYKYNSKILQNKYKLQLNSYKELEKSQDNLKRIHHDINNHNIILHSLISNNEYDKALCYLNEFNLNLKINEYHLYTNHKILNALFLNKSNVCENNKINLDMHINIPSTISISDFNLCILVGNLMDNAIEACEYLNSDKYIKVTCKLVNDNFTLQVINSYNGNICVSKDKILSIKKDRLNHGLGITNVKSIVNELNGNYYFNFSKKEFCVIITIPL